MTKNTTYLDEQILLALAKPYLHERVEAVKQLISNREKLARIDEVNRIAIDKELDLKWYLRFDGAECNPQESGEENVANAVMDYVEKRQKELATLRKELDGEEPTNE